MIKPHYFKAWFIFYLVATAGGLLIGFAVGMIVGNTVGVLLVSKGEEGASAYHWLSIAIGLLVAISVSFLSFKWAVRKYILEPICLETNLELEPKREYTEDYP